MAEIYNKSNKLTRIISIDQVESDDRLFKSCLSLTSNREVYYTSDDYYESYKPEITPDIRKVVISNNVRRIGNFAFYFLTDLKEVIIPKSVKSIGNSAFNSALSLMKIDVKTVEEIGGNAFESSIIQHIDLPNVKIINDYAFARCKELKTVNFSNKLEYICRYAFYECYNLESITIPDSIKGIGDGAFQNCTNLKTVRFPKKIKLGTNIFEGCNKLKEIIFDDVEEVDFYESIEDKKEKQKRNKILNDLAKKSMCFVEDSDFDNSDFVDDSDLELSKDSKDLKTIITTQIKTQTKTTTQTTTTQTTKITTQTKTQKIIEHNLKQNIDDYFSDKAILYQDFKKILGINNKAKITILHGIYENIIDYGFIDETMLDEMLKTLMKEHEFNDKQEFFKFCLKYVDENFDNRFDEVVKNFDLVKPLFI